MKKLLFIGLAVVTLSACGTMNPYYSLDVSKVSTPAHSITTTNRQNGFFLVDVLNPKTGKPVLNFGAMDMTGRGIIAKYGLTRPRDHIKNELLDKVSGKLTAKKLISNKTISFHTDENTLNSITHTYGDADLVLDVTDKNWVLEYRDGAYHLELGAESRLYEVATGKLLAFVSCDPKSDPSIKGSDTEFLQSNAALLKKEIKKLSSMCAEQIFQRMFASR